MPPGPARIRDRGAYLERVTGIEPVSTAWKFPAWARVVLVRAPPNGGLCASCGCVELHEGGFWAACNTGATGGPWEADQRFPNVLHERPQGSVELAVSSRGCVCGSVLCRYVGLDSRDLVVSLVVDLDRPGFWGDKGPAPAVPTASNHLTAIHGSGSPGRSAVGCAVFAGFRAGSAVGCCRVL